MRLLTVLFGIVVPTSIAGFPASGVDARRGSVMPLQTMTFDEILAAKAAGTGCTWLGGSSLTLRMAMKKGRGAVKRGGRIVRLHPVSGAEGHFPYTYRHWRGGGMNIVIADSGRSTATGPEHVETIATLTLHESGRRRSWRGRLSCGS